MALDNKSIKAKWDNVRFDKAAIEHHAQRYKDGAVYPLAKICYQYTMLQKEEGGKNDKIS